MARTATQVLQLVMEAVSKAPATQQRHDLMRKLRMCQDMASSFGLDVPVTGEMSEEGKKVLKNSSAGGSVRVATTATRKKEKEDVTES